ncbi:MAG: ribonuclease HI [Deltaproteobacteria bacterium]|nr:ribonuclease HI [Deltaproteobacteria bacterium]
METKKKFYAVAQGRNKGIFTAWFGPGGAEAQIKEFPGARYRGFPTIDEARQWLAAMASGALTVGKSKTEKKSSAPAQAPHAQDPADGRIIIYTDGGCSFNPGPGGYGAVIIDGDARQELSGGFRLTTNNRMELSACIEGLKALPASSSVMLFSDSKYVVDAATKGWAKKWRANGWMRTATDAAENYDLWDKLLDLCEKHSVEFVWVKGHAGNTENECCDRLATTAAAGRNLPADTAYEHKKTRIT